jgi:cell division protein ZapA (FtsZ GTPase activity inhibitor)
VIDSGLFIWLLETYGIAAVMLLILSVWMFQLRKYVKQLKKNVHDRIDEKAEEIDDLQVTVSRFHDNCHIPRGMMNEVKQEIKELKEKDHQIETDLVGIRVTVNSSNVMITQLHDHFLQKGLDAGATKEPST